MLGPHSELGRMALVCVLANSKLGLHLKPQSKTPRFTRVLLYGRKLPLSTFLLNNPQSPIQPMMLYEGIPLYQWGISLPMDMETTDKRGPCNYDALSPPYPMHPLLYVNVSLECRLPACLPHSCSNLCNS